MNVYIRFENRDCSDKDYYCPNQTFKLTYDEIKKMSIKKVYELISDDEIDKRDYNWDNEY